MYATENVIALMCSDRLSSRFSMRRNWEVDFVLFLDIPLLQKNSLLILLLWTTSGCVVMIDLLQRRLEKP